MFDHHQRIAGIPQPLHDGDDAVHVARVQADGRLVENEQRVDQRGAQGGGEVDALHLAARERAGLAVQREVIQPHVVQEAQAGADLGHQQVGGLVQRRRQVQAGHQPVEPVDGQQHDVVHGQAGQGRELGIGPLGAHGAEAPVGAGVFTGVRGCFRFGIGLPVCRACVCGCKGQRGVLFIAHPPQQRFGLEAGALAGRAGRVGAVLGEQHPDVHLVRLAFQPGEEVADAVPLALPVARPVRVTVDDPAPVGLRQLVPGAVEVDAGGIAVFHQFGLGLLEAGGLPGLDGPLGQRPAAVGNDQAQVQPDDAAEALAGLAGTQRRVEGKEAGAGRLVADVAGGAGKAVAECPACLFVAFVVQRDDGQAAMTAFERRFEAAGQPVFGDIAEAEAVGHDGQPQGGRGRRPGGFLPGGGSGGGFCTGVRACASRRIVDGFRGGCRCPGSGRCLGGGCGTGLPAGRFFATPAFALRGGLRRQHLPRVDAGVALGLQLVQRLLFAEAGRYVHGEGDEQARIVQAGRAVVQGGGDAGHVILAYRLGALPAVQRGGVGHQQLQVVVQLGHRAHGGARGADRVGLVDGDGRRDAVDAVHLRPVHAVEELAGVGGEGFHIAPLALGIEGVEHER